MSYLDSSILFASCVLLKFSLISCTNEQEPEQSLNQTYEIACGTVTFLDDYPLYSLNYTSDYQFDEYLESGSFPALVVYIPEKDRYGCTCFTAFGSCNRLFGRNFDWNESSTYYILFTNPPDGYASVSTVDMGFFEYDPDKPPDHPANLNTLQILPYFPFDGMNEKGVAIGMNALPYSQSPYDSLKVTIGELQLIRLVLDYAASTSEAITLVQQYNIQMEDPPIHYLIADTSGRSVILEFIDGSMNIVENSNPWQVTTNFVIYSWDDPYNAGCWRYQIAWNTLQNASGVLSDTEVMDLLQAVSVSTTRWSSIFNLNNGQLKIALGRDYENIHQFVLD